MSIPKDAVASDDFGRTFVYYIGEDGSIYYIVGPDKNSSEQQDADDGKRYGAPVQVLWTNDNDGSKNPARGNTTEPTLAVLNYSVTDDAGNTTNETRLYYIDEISEIVELIWTSVGEPGSGGKWSKGDLTWRRYKAAKGSLLTAFEDGKNIKVFFQSDGSTALSVAWRTREVNAKAWDKRVVTKTF